ncbi:MAG: SUMF1/EgtB/PvdO family nonheme iron enzyme [Candidatus Kapabacteria bacterium]|nr:SUMF1/EgtB/PvdO family nonheme iron enzyme [Candidatus Kapabacteria bacterium]
MKFIIKILLCCALFYSCQEDIPLQPSKPEIKEIQPTQSGVWTVITIYGKNLGLPQDSSFVILDSNIKILSKECLKWNNTYIRLKLPKLRFNGNIKVVNNKDTSNTLKINFNYLPEIHMILVNAGIADIGSNNGWYDEKPAHRVNIPNNLYVSKYEVSQYLYSFVCDTNPSSEIAEKLPVNNIQWLDAIIFCNNLSKLFDYDTCYVFDKGNIIWDTNANGFRLPTEAEWEFFCKAGYEGDYNADESIENLAWFNKNSGYKIQPIGKKKPNRAGIYDLHGNVSEWCWDWYDENYYKQSETINPKGPKSGLKRVHRGGSFLDGFAKLRSSARHYDDGNYKNLGIRFVRNAKD